MDSGPQFDVGDAPMLSGNNFAARGVAATFLNVLPPAFEAVARASGLRDAPMPDLLSEPVGEEGTGGACQLLDPVVADALSHPSPCAYLVLSLPLPGLLQQSTPLLMCWWRTVCLTFAPSPQELQGLSHWHASAAPASR